MVAPWWEYPYPVTSIWLVFSS